MIASERLLVGAAGENGHNLMKKLPLSSLKSGRPVKIYVIDPRKFQERLEKYVGNFEKPIPDKKSKQEGARVPQTTRHGHTDHKYVKKPISSGVYRSNATIAPKEPTPLPSLKPILPAVAVATTTSEAASLITGHSHTITYSVNPNHSDQKPKQVQKKKPVKKRKLTMGSMKNSTSEKKAEDAEMAFLMKETTTRTGRVSKSSTLATATAAASTGNAITSQPGSPLSGTYSAAPSPSPSVTSVGSQGRGRKREPPEMFRCQTCRKVYLGHTKFNLHFKKFPTHQKPDATTGVLSKKTKPTEESDVLNYPLDVPDLLSSDNGTIPNGSTPITSFSDKVHPLMKASNGIGPHLEIQVHPDPNSQPSPYNIEQTRRNQALANLSDEDTLGMGGFSPIMRTLSTSTINPDTLSDNCTSPKLPNFSADSDPIFIQTDSTLRQSHPDLQPITVPDLCLSSEMEPVLRTNSEYFMEFPSDFSINSHISISQIPTELIGTGSCSQQSFNSLENLLADSNSQIGHPSPEQPSGGRRQSESEIPSIPSSSCTGGGRRTPTFFPKSVDEGVNTIKQNSNMNVSSYVSGNVNVSSIPKLSTPSLPVVAVDEESRDICISNGGDDNDGKSGTESSLDGCENANHAGSSVSTRRRSIWEFVKEQIRLCGINQACGEISEMAEKLSKVARDKFYPIREEEIERLGNSSPVIQVDTPFISHLLDLPFGTYIFKEDGGIRRIIPPPTPVSSELSLTGGVEVDIDKFLSPDIDLISLPHLTNLDFNSICND